MDCADEALWFRFTTSSPPNWRCLQSFNTASVTGPWKPTIITAPTSSSRVRPPGPSRGDGVTTGDVAGDADAVDGLGLTTCAEGEPEHAARRTAKKTTNDLRAVMARQFLTRDPLPRFRGYATASHSSSSGSAMPAAAGRSSSTVTPSVAITVTPPTSHAKW